MLLKAAILSLALLAGCMATSTPALSPEEFMNPDNIYGKWKVVGFQDSYRYIVGRKHENYVEKQIGKEITFGKQSYNELGYSKNYGYDLKSSYDSCDSINLRGECGWAINMAYGKIRKIVDFETCDPKTFSPRCVTAYSISMYIFKNGDVRFFVPTDGGYFVIEKIK